MKTFFTVFFAILAATVVIFIGLSTKARLDQWERAKQMCYVQISSEVDAMKVRLSQDQADTLAQRAQDSSDVVEVGRRAGVTLRAIEEGQHRILVVEQTLVTILENKPFGLPLTADERKSLDSAKAAIQKDVEKPK
jgi:acyl-coenzyme A synthetase/AMP-(fatty) acid ligase